MPVIEKTTTESIFEQVMPCIGVQVTPTRRNEIINFISERVIPLLNSHEIAAKYMAEFIEIGSVKIDGITYKKGLHDGAFIRKLKEKLK